MVKRTTSHSSSGFAIFNPGAKPKPTSLKNLDAADPIIRSTAIAFSDISANLISMSV
jgi:hypothetical protein